jgi:N-acetyl-anhydromuramyl-L-alanine amidase AmpD
MAKHRTRVGLHARNTVLFPEADYALVREARIETLKMMSHTDVTVFQRLRQENPGIEFIVRLYDDRLRNDSRPSPAAFAAKMVPLINSLQPYADKFEIHNEPNHVEGVEGWGASDQEARSFRNWYLQVLTALRQQCPWAKFGFPGLAVPDLLHRDLSWLEICRDVIEASDWLGCHCYWQYGNMMKEKWGLCFQLYHERFPTKQIEITEFGNSTPAKELSREEMAQQYAQYYKELNKYPYLGSASAFIASSPDPSWVPFVWMKEGGERLPVVKAVRNMDRTPVEIPPSPQPSPEPVPGPTERKFPETGKTVRDSFLQFFERYGLDICGYPITDQFEEFGLQAQYFQRMALEEFKPGQIRLKLVGTEAWTSRDKITQLETRVKELSERSPSGGGAGQPTIEDIVDKLPKHATKRYTTRSLSDIQQIVIHHTATSATITPQRIAEYQVHTLAKPGIAYHFFVAADGKIYQTNNLETVSDHAYSRNQESVGVCFAGNFTSAIPPTPQLEAGAQLCAWLLTQLHLPVAKIVGLGEFVNTQSPGKQWLSGQKWKEKLLAEVEAALQTGGDDQSALIASLREQIEALQAEIDRLRKQTPGPTPTPVPGPTKISQPAIQDMIDTLPKHKTKKYNSRKLSEIQNLVIHHSAVAASVGPKRIAEYHVTKQDWPGIGYHFLVGDTGTIYQGNALTTVSFHAAKVNPRGVGICFLGSFQKEVPPPAQLQAGAHLVAWLMQELNLDLEVVKGHQEFMQTACPGNQWLKGKKWKQMLREEVANVQKGVAPTPTPVPTPEPVPSGAKPIYHYVLFWTRNGTWAERDWLNAQGYIGRFHPSVGFRVNDAAQAEYVTIVGGPLGVPKSAEDWLTEQGCKVDRIAGKDEADTKRMLDELADQGNRFLAYDE